MQIFIRSFFSLLISIVPFVQLFCAQILFPDLDLTSAATNCWMHPKVDWIFGFLVSTSSPSPKPPSFDRKKYYSRVLKDR